MKIKLYVILVLFSLISMASNAQINQGTIFTSGSTSFSHTGTKGGMVKSTSYSALAGAFILDDFVIGMSYGRSSVKYDINYDPLDIGDPLYQHWGPKDITASVMEIFSRLYLKSFFLGPGFTRTRINDLNASHISLKTGYAAFLNNFVSVEPSVAYYKELNDVAESYMAINIAFGIYLNR